MSPIDYHVYPARFLTGDLNRDAGTRLGRTDGLSSHPGKIGITKIGGIGVKDFSRLECWSLSDIQVFIVSEIYSLPVGLPYYLANISRNVDFGRRSG